MVRKLGLAYFLTSFSRPPQFATDLPPGDAAREKIRNIDELERTIARVNRIANSSNPYYHEFFTPQTIGE